MIVRSKRESKWIDFGQELENPIHQLICIPHAGSGASFFNHWQAVIGDQIEILPIQLAGRENRIFEEPMTDCIQISTILCEELLKFVKLGRFSIFGHSMGAIIAYEVTRQLEKEYMYPPQYCFLSSTYIEENSLLIKSADLNDHDFFERLKLYGGIDESNAIMQDEEFRRLFMKIFRADFAVSESYKKDNSSLLHVPICTYCGTEDKMVSPEDMKTWSNFTESKIEHKIYKGDHFYLTQHCKELCDDIKSYLLK